MSSLDSDLPDVGPFIEALRSDLPGEEHQRRIHARLVAAGFVAGTGLTLPSVAAGASAGAGASLLPKLAALSWGAKLGLASVVIAAGAVPIANELGRRETSGRPTAVAATTEGEVQTGSNASPLAALATDDDRLQLQSEEASPAASSSVLAARAPAPAPRTRRPEALAQSTPPESASGPSVGALPSVEASGSAVHGSRENALREEAAVLERALAALRSGDRATALQWLAEHARRFPDGRLRRERERARERANDTSQ